jgi:hypothetical protein
VILIFEKRIFNKTITNGTAGEELEGVGEETSVLVAVAIFFGITIASSLRLPRHEKKDCLSR